MTAKPGDEPDLEAISGPSIAPSDAPDELTEKAIKQAERAAKKLTPTQLIDRHLTQACIARDRLEEEKNRLQGDLNQLSANLGSLAVEHQKLKDTHRFSVGANTLSAVLLTIGSAFVSTASVRPSFTLVFLAVGYTMIGCGVLISLIIYLWSR